MSESTFGLSKKEELVIGLRQQGLTLEAIGNRLGVTRERIRQIENKATKRIKASSLLEFLRGKVNADFLRRRFSSAAVIADLARSHAPNETPEAQRLATHLLLEEVHEDGYPFRGNVALRSPALVPIMDGLVRLSAEVLLRDGSLCLGAALHMLYTEHIERELPVDLGKSILRNCLDELAPLAQSELVTMRRKARGPWLARRVLEAACVPLHWSTVAERVNDLRSRLGLASLNPRTVHGALTRCDDFSYQDQGTYGLRSWASDVSFLRRLIREALEEAGEPMTFGEIWERVTTKRRARNASVKMYLELHPDFFRARTGRYGLRAWLPEKPTLKTQRDLVESERSARRMDRRA